MSIKINNLKLPLNEDTNYLRDIVSKKLGINESKIKNFCILKEAVDARRRNVTLTYNICVELYGDEKKVVSKICDNNIIYVEPKQEPAPQVGSEKMTGRPVIIGMGPAGLFAGLILARKGYRPLLIERGADMDERTRIVHTFWESGKFSSVTNVQFGEGGAGTFSDGKLTTRINDRRCKKVLKELVDGGAPEEILYKGKPHIGTDKLKTTVKNIRNSIISLGGEVKFYSKVTDITIKNNCVYSVKINDDMEVKSSVVILAIGHSARDTYEMLLNKGINITQKAFSIGVRIEHPQELIDKAQYGKYAGHPKLKAADYQLVYKGKDRTCYSFCMCPGGVVVAAASEPGYTVTNGMSEFARDRENANSALVVSVGTKDFESKHPLAGVQFQRKWEKLAFREGGKNYKAPIQLVGDFLKGVSSNHIGKIKPSYTRGVVLSDISKCLPNYVVKTMKDGLRYFERKINGYSTYDAVLTGVETRTSAPIRIQRDESGQAIGITGLYPAGEGAGYAGGIISAAVDGVKIAEKIIEKYVPLD